ncbi:MFS transporter [Paraglaciecola arctica]|uniref:MFS transporter n=1 Tax=Paraglaciecola arctica TaxID=1128911 RepID=UPI00208FFE9F|nr:MFS transporter [Paraglaciecola arctica]
MKQDTHKYDHSRLFLIASLALFTAALSVALRAAVAGDIKAEYLDPVNIANAGELIAQALAMSFLGFSIVLFGLSPFLDSIGMKPMLIGAALLFIVGNVLIVAADIITSAENIYWAIWLGMLFNGLAWGAIEATINPMTTSLYPKDKTHRLNVLHAWWPAGLILGGLLGVGAGAIDINWKLTLIPILVSTLAFVWLCIGTRFPKTERFNLGVSTPDMFKETFRKPSFFVWFGAMFLTATTELAPGQWVDIALTNTVGMRGILLLVYVSGLMFVIRHFAGPLSRWLSDVGLLFISSMLAAIGLYMLSIADSPFSGLLAATFWGAGVAFMWPTMLAAVAQRYPNGGAWLIGLMGAAGALSVYFVLPILGKIYDEARNSALNSAENTNSFSTAELLHVDALAAAASFQKIAIFPVILFVLFGGIWLLKLQKSH